MADQNTVVHLIAYNTAITITANCGKLKGIRCLELLACSDQRSLYLSYLKVLYPISDSEQL